MTKPKYRKFDELLTTGLNEALEFKAGYGKARVYTESIPPVDIKFVRQKMNLNQVDFAAQFHLPISSLQQWEQGRRQPDVAALLLLRMIAQNPKKTKAMLDKAVQPAH